MTQARDVRINRHVQLLLLTVERLGSPGHELDVDLLVVDPFLSRKFRFTGLVLHLAAEDSITLRVVEESVPAVLLDSRHLLYLLLIHLKHVLLLAKIVQVFVQSDLLLESVKILGVQAVILV